MVDTQTSIVEDKNLYYDPPSGWMYNFPKPYLPIEGESLRETLKRDGFPVDRVSFRGTRFFGSGAIQSERNNYGY